MSEGLMAGSMTEIGAGMLLVICVFALFVALRLLYKVSGWKPTLLLSGVIAWVLTAGVLIVLGKQ
jgi:uncharacterized membrane protein (GlpM family)